MYENDKWSFKEEMTCDVRNLELRINESLWRAKRWLNSRGLKMANLFYGLVELTCYLSCVYNWFWPSKYQTSKKRIPSN